MAQNYIIPVKKNKPHQRIEVELSGKVYVIYLTWLQRASSWMLDLFDENETPLILCKLLSNRSDILADNRWDTRIPPGSLGVFSQIPDILPTYKNLGNEFNLYYYEF